MRKVPFRVLRCSVLMDRKDCKVMFVDLFVGVPVGEQDYEESYE